MQEIKSYTDIEQSRKLAEILPIESADACWTNHLFADILSSWRLESTPPQKYKSPLDRFVVKGYLIEPAWSLAALLSVLPNENMLVKTTNSEYYCIAIDVTTKHYNNPVDACYELILKLKELNLL